MKLLQHLISLEQHLDMIEIPLDDGSALYDTPGIINHHQMAHHIDASELKYIMPKKEIKPKVYQQNAGQTLFIGALARFDFIQGERSAFTVMWQMIYQFIARS